MNELLKKLKTPSDCERFAANARAKGREDLALAAERRAIEFNAATHGTATQVEKECLQAIYAYERIRSDINGRTTRANRTWQMIDRHGILPAVERAVNRPTDTAGYTALASRGLQDLAFEAVVLRYPELFSPEAVERCRERLRELGANAESPPVREDQ